MKLKTIITSAALLLSSFFLWAVNVYCYNTKPRSEINCLHNNKPTMDTIIVENIVQFDKYKNTDAINFIMKVTNHSKNPIPDLSLTNMSKYVNFYINGKIDNPLNMYNGVEAINGVKTIAIDSTKTFGSGWVLSPNCGLLITYGNEFTVQWEYMKIKSKIIKVNVKNKTTETLNY